MDPLIVLFGLGVGLLVGLTGMGGGSLMTPILILLFGYSPVTAVGTDLAYGAVTKTVGGWRHLKHRTVNSGLSWWMAIGSVPAAVGGVYALHALEKATGRSFDSVVLGVLAGTLAFTGAMVLARALFLQHLIDRERETFVMTRREKVMAVVLGVFVGFVLGVTSAGSGTLIAVGLIMLFHLAPRQVVATDIFHAAILLWAAAAAHVVAGNVDYGLMGTILIGSLPGVWIGSHLSIKTPVATLRTALGVVMIGASLGLASKAGLDIPTPVMAGVPILLIGILAFSPARRWLRAPRTPVAAAAPER